MKRTILITVMLIVCSCTVLFAQEYNQEHRIWLAYTGQCQVSKHFGYHLEAQFRMDNQLEFSKQNLFRIGAIYYLSPSKSFTVGYGLITTYKPSLDDYFNENRVWQQYQYNHKWLKNKNTITHRFRLEQRWVEQLAQVDGNVISTGREYQNRLRILNRNLFHLFTFKDTNNEVYALLQNELFVTLGDNKINKNFMDQNRFLIGFGLNYNNHIRMELGYLNHYVTSSTSKDVMNHTVSIALIQNLDLTKH